MTVQELSQLFYLEKLIAREQKRLQTLKDAALVHSPSFSSMPHAPGVYDKVGEVVPKIVEQMETIQARQQQYIETRERLQAYIDNIADPHIKLIMLYCFVDLMSWQAVAEAVGGNNSEDSVKKLCYRYLKRSQNNIKETIH